MGFLRRKLGRTTNDLASASGTCLPGKGWGVASSERSQKAGLVGWALVLSFFMSPCSPFIAPPSTVSQRVPASIHGHGPTSNSLTSPPVPRPHRTRPPPCSPQAVCQRTAMEDLGEWGPGPLSLSPLPASIFPTHTPHFSHSSFLPPFSRLCLPVPPSQIHVPFPVSPFLPARDAAPAPSVLP